MLRPVDVIRQPLRWIRPSKRDRFYELRAGSSLMATLTFRSPFGSLAIAHSPDGSWSFKRVGFWNTKATVRAEGIPGELAVFEHNTGKGGGTLHLTGGRSLLVTANLRQTEIEFRESEEHVLFRYRTEGFFRQAAGLEVMPALAGTREMPWLLLFGWYLVVMMHEDATHCVPLVG